MRRLIAASGDGTFVVPLTAEDEDSAVEWGRARHQQHVGDPGRFWARPSERANIESVRARIALAYWMGRTFDGTPRPRGSRLERETGDVAPGIHTRYHHPNGYLRVRENDPPDHLYFLIVPGPSHTLRIVGFALGRDVMRDGYWRASWQHPCWAVRHDDPTIIPAATFEREWIDGDGFGWQQEDGRSA